MNFQPAISIIIATKNAKNLLIETLDSIQKQSNQPLEVVVIDGASTDGTQAVLGTRPGIRFISEPDKGISDAFNKGIALATGDYINFQGAGDLLHPNSLTSLFADLDESYTLICGKILRVQEDGQTPLWTAPKTVGPFNPRSLLYKLTLPHQGLFTHRRFFEQYGLFDLSVKFAMDYEHLLRAYHHFPKAIVKDVVVSSWREGGVGQNRLDEIYQEYHRIKQRHQVAHPIYLSYIDKYNRLKALLKAML